MRVLLIVSTIVVVCRARPDMSNVPSSSYLPTAGQTTGGFDSPHINDISGGIGNIDETNHIDGFGGYPQAQDQKHIYFYAAPDEPQFIRYRIVVTPQSHKHTKIIFIKAPHHGIIPEVIAPPSIAENKILVYVLVKKPDQDGSVTIPAGLNVKHTKPEVFFIKYNNKHDAESQVSGGVQGQRVGTNVPDVDNEQSFVNTLDSDVGEHNPGETHFHIDSDNIPSGKYGPPGVSGPY